MWEFLKLANNARTISKDLRWCVACPSDHVKDKKEKMVGRRNSQGFFSHYCSLYIFAKEGSNLPNANHSNARPARGLYAH